QSRRSIHRRRRTRARHDCSSRRQCSLRCDRSAHPRVASQATAAVARPGDRVPPQYLRGHPCRAAGHQRTLPTVQSGRRKSKGERAMYEEIIYEVEEPVATITINRPARLNALTARTQVGIKHAMIAAERDERVVGIILTGAGRAFSAGADMRSL